MIKELSLYGSKEGEQYHAWIIIGEEKLKIVWKTRLWFQVTEWVRGIDCFVNFVGENNGSRNRN